MLLRQLAIYSLIIYAHAQSNRIAEVGSMLVCAACGRERWTAIAWLPWQAAVPLPNEPRLRIRRQRSVHPPAASCICLQLLCAACLASCRAHSLSCMHATCHVLSYSDPTVYLATTHFSTYAEARVGNLCNRQPPAAALCDFYSFFITGHCRCSVKLAR